MPDDDIIVEEEPLCPQCKEETMEHVDAADMFEGNPGVKDFWRCNWCGHTEPAEV